MDGKRLEYKGDEALKELERLTMNPHEVQESLLKDVITRNKDNGYLFNYMKRSTNVSTFKSRFRVINYNVVLPYIERIANGLGEGKAMYLYLFKAETTKPCSLAARTVLTSYYKSEHFKNRSRDPYNDYISPDEVIFCEDNNQSMYCQLLTGLVHRSKVLRLRVVFSSTFLRVISFLQQNWTMLCHDIMTCKLDQSITDLGCRFAMPTVLLLDNPTIVDEIESVCNCDSWEGILCCLWPKAKFIEAVVTGSIAQYVPSLECYASGNLPLACPMYASFESYFGLNLKPLSKPKDVSFTFLPNMCYFEFIPLGDDGKWTLNSNVDDEVPSDKAIDLVHVKVGCYYELVVTAFVGIYVNKPYMLFVITRGYIARFYSIICVDSWLNRYRISDVLKVIGFHNKAPQFWFIYMKNVVLSIDNDNANEEDLHKSVSEAKKLLEPQNAILVEYTSYPDTSTIDLDKRGWARAIFFY